MERGVGIIAQHFNAGEEVDSQAINAIKAI